MRFCFMIEDKELNARIWEIVGCIEVGGGVGDGLGEKERVARTRKEQPRSASGTNWFRLAVC